LSREPLVENGEDEVLEDGIAEELQRSIAEKMCLLTRQSIWKVNIAERRLVSNELLPPREAPNGKGDGKLRRVDLGAGQSPIGRGRKAGSWIL